MDRQTMVEIFIQFTFGHWILKDNNNNLIGYYEIEKHENKEFELINMGILSDYRSKGYGSLLLTHVLKNSSDNNAKKVWVHTCSLDHKFALANYISREVLKYLKKNRLILLLNPLLGKIKISSSIISLIE